MKVKDIFPKLQYLMEHHPDDEFHVVVKSNSMGGVPTSKVKHISQGIDWNRGHILIECEDELQKIKPQ